MLAVIIGFQAAKRATEFALANPARETLFTVLPREQMYKSKSFIDTTVFRGADAASGWVYTGLRQALQDAAHVAALAAVVAVGWAVMVIRLGRMQRRLAEPTADAKAPSSTSN